MKKNIILDRFPIDAVEFFKFEFERNFGVKIITSIGKNDKSLDVLQYEDRQIGRGFEFKNSEWVLTSDDIEWFSRYEGLFQTLLSRYGINQHVWTVSEMSNHYFSLINFWKSRIIENKISACFSYHPPHDPSSFSLFLISKYLRIPYIFVDMVIIANRYRILGCSFKHRNLLIQFDGVNMGEFNSYIENYISKIRFDQDGAAPVYMNYFHNVGNGSKIIKKLSQKFASLKFSDLKVKWLERVNSYLKFNRKSWVDSNNEISLLRLNIFLKYKQLKLFLESIKYEKKCIKIFSKDLKYIYFAAPLLPEASLLPQTLSRHNILHFIRMIAKVLPKDIIILYKVNPFQFDARMHYSSVIDWINQDFYSELQLYENLRFVSHKKSTLDLITGSVGVACINGTVAFEAIAKGKRCMTYSSNWYDSLDGIDLISSSTDVANSLELMIRDVTPSPHGNQLFLNSKAVFDFEQWIDNDFIQTDREKLMSCFLNSYEIFEKLDDRKWEV